MQDENSPQLESMTVTAWRSPKRADTYLFIPAELPFEELPEALQAQFEGAEAFYTFELDSAREMPQADAQQVLTALRERGFYLQMPPPPSLPEKAVPEKEVPTDGDDRG